METLTAGKLPEVTEVPQKRPGIIKLLITAGLLAIAVAGAKKATAFINKHEAELNAQKDIID